MELFRVSFWWSNTLFILLLCCISPTANVALGTTPAPPHLELYMRDSLPTDTVQEVVIRQQYANKDIPVPHTILRLEALRRDDGMQLSSALNRVPGIHMHMGTYGTQRLVVRGIGSRSTFGTSKLRVYLDDIPLTSVDGETILEQLDVSILDEIRVYKGPAPAIYGSGLGGLIQLNTIARRDEDRPGADEPSRLSLGQEATIGSFGLFRHATNFKSIGNKWQLWFNYNSARSQGWRDNQEMNRRGGVVNVRRTWRHGGYTSLYASLTEFMGEIPSSLNLKDYENNPEMANPAWKAIHGREKHTIFLGALSHRFLVHRGKRIHTESVSSGILRIQNTDEIRPFNNLNQGAGAFVARTQVNIKKSDAPQGSLPLLAIGGELQYDDNSIFTPGNFSYVWIEKTFPQFFAQSYFKPLPRLSLLMGANTNALFAYQNSYSSINNSNNNSSQEIGFRWYPHVGATYQITSPLQIFGTWSRGFSLPSSQESLHADGSFNPAIRNEIGENRELGMRIQKQHLTAELSLYDMPVRDLIVAERVGPDQYIGLNAGKTRHSGIEADVRARLGYGFSGFGTYSFARYRFIEFAHRGIDFSGKVLPGIAPHHIQAGLDYTHASGLAVRLSHQYLSAYPIRDDNTISTKSSALLHLQVNYSRMILGVARINLFLGIQNLTNTKYASMILTNADTVSPNPRYYYPGQPRNWYIGVRYTATN